MAIQPLTPTPPSGASGNGLQTAGRPSSGARATSAQAGDETGATSASPTTTARAVEAEAQLRPAEPTREEITKAVDEVKRALDPVARNLQFSIDDVTGRTVVKVVDTTTKEIIRQIPSDELLAITRALDKFSGLFVKQKA